MSVHIPEYQSHRDVTGLRESARRVIKALEPIRDKFDVIYVTGQSGIVPGSIAAYTLRKRIVILRKEGERAHGNRICGSYYLKDRPVIVDDFSEYGGTLETLIKSAPYTCWRFPYLVLYSQVLKPASDLPAGATRIKGTRLFTFDQEAFLASR